VTSDLKITEVLKCTRKTLDSYRIVTCLDIVIQYTLAGVAHFRWICCTRRQCELSCFGPQVWSCDGFWWWRQESEHVGCWEANLYHGEYLNRAV